MTPPQVHCLRDDLKAPSRVVHNLYGAGLLQHVHPGAPGKLPTFGHAVFDDDGPKCGRVGRRVLLRDLVPEPVPIPGQRRMELVT